MGGGDITSAFESHGWIVRGRIATLDLTMDRETLEFYDRTAGETSARYRAMDLSAWRQQSLQIFPARGRVLDVGAGSGRDLALLLSMGFQAYGVEPAEGMRAEAVRTYPQLEGRIFPFGLPLPGDADVGLPFDGVVCSAVLMHLPESELSDAVLSLRRVLREKGRLWISVSGSRPGLNEENRDDTGRLFTRLNPECLVLLIEGLKFQLLRRWEEADRLGRPSIRWNNLLFELNGG